MSFPFHQSPAQFISSQPAPGGGAKTHASERKGAIEDWPWLDQDVLRSSRSRSRQVCMTFHFFRHHPGPNGIPLLCCQLDQGLIAHDSR